MKTHEKEPNRILRTKESCQFLGMSRRTFGRRLEDGWKQGHWFFKEKREWCIRAKHLEQLVAAMENGELSKNNQEC